jgi:hypothetical protein
MNRRLVTVPSKRILPISIAHRYLELQLLRKLVRQAENAQGRTSVNISSRQPTLHACSEIKKDRQLRRSLG